MEVLGEREVVTLQMTSEERIEIHFGLNHVNLFTWVKFLGRRNVKGEFPFLKK